MTQEYFLTVANEAHDSFEEKKSQFIGYTSPIETEEQALVFIKKIKEKHSDARHNVYAYVNKEGNVVRFNDDGEPQGTGGMPVLDVIKKNNLTGVVIVVTRYFGGILLGASGLTRAYSKAARMAVEKAGIAKFIRFCEISFDVDYGLLQKIQFELSKMNITVIDIKYEASVNVCSLVKEEQLESFKTKLLDITSGKTEIHILGTKYGKE